MEPPYVIYRADDNDTPEPTPPRNSRWYRLTAWIRRHRHTWARVPDWAREPGNWISALIIAVVLGVALALIAGLGWLLWTIITGIGHGIEVTGNLISAAVHTSGALLRDTGRWITHGPITHSVSDPVRHYLDIHATGLPATGRDLWIVWLVAVGVLYLGALAGSTYARIGWAAIGALSATAAYFGAPAGTGPAAAGLTVTVWLLLSLLAYARTRSASVLEQISLDIAERRTAREYTTTGKA